MKTFAWLIAVSLTANVLLAGVWLRNRPASPHATTGATAEAASTAPGSRPRSGSATRVTTSTSDSAPETDVAPSTITTWKDIQAADLKEFIRRLRAVGCPEETVQDIIVAEVDRRYAARIRELWPDRYKVKDFWEVEKRDPAQEKKNRARWRQERELQKEKSALLVELLGIDPQKELLREQGLDEPMNWQEQRVAFLPEARREAVLKYLEDFEDKMQDFYSRTRGMWDAESRAEQRQLEAEKLQGLAQYLSPQELREYELRQSQLASQLSHDLRGLSLTRQEYESIYDIRKKYGESIYNYGDVETKEARQKVEDNKKALKEELAAALGPDKIREYERAGDYNYQQLMRLAKRNDLPADTATRVYDYKQTAEDGAKKLREDKSLTNEQRQEALRKIRAETEKAVKESLGEKNYKRYLREGGWWINNIAPAIRVQSTIQPTFE